MTKDVKVTVTTTTATFSIGEDQIPTLIATLLNASGAQKPSIAFDTPQTEMPASTLRTIGAESEISNKQAQSEIPETAHIAEVMTDNDLIISESGRRVQSNNTSGAPDIYWNKWHRKWHVRLRENGDLLHLGYFQDCMEEAIVLSATDAR